MKAQKCVALVFFLLILVTYVRSFTYEDRSKVQRPVSPEKMKQCSRYTSRTALQEFAKWEGILYLVLLSRWEVDSGKRVAPRIATCGPKLDGAKPRFPGSIPIARPEEARTALRRVSVDFVRVLDSSPNIPHDAYLALLDEAKRQHLPVTGHVAHRCRGIGRRTGH